MEEIFALILSLLLVVVLVPLYIWKRRSDSGEEQQQVPERERVRERETVVRATGARRMRRRPAAGASTSSARAEAVEGKLAVLNLFPSSVLSLVSHVMWENGIIFSVVIVNMNVNTEIVEGSDDEAVEGEPIEAKSSKKEKKRQEREDKRQADEAARESRQSKQDHYEETRRRKDEEREARERALEEEANAQKAKEEEAAALDFEKWKGEFSVDAEGTTENEVQGGSQDLLSEFVEYIKKHKCVPLEDLAAEFKLRTQECINRITSLESIGRLSGVMDDRGKYIYISLEEMKAVADYIKRQGRVSISHLASKSNQFIDLESKAQLIEDISGMEEIAAA
ncbi:hypothetical protein EZV62_009127 [Acer yangbiense]|uniref:DDRGK domain-containing protein 1 n=1 Tax=Acer yangbiense TaxID=1000413 RepID=A0A5C7IFU9_9ROSI|nr:hypothetical protein EZV62_009127 [Acer yangbiense]